MTLETARDMAVEGLEKAFRQFRPKVYVKPYDGILSFKEAKKVFSNTPALLVSALTGDDEHISLAVYLLATCSDENLLTILDTAMAALRSLSGKGRNPLTVSSRSLYDPEALTAGLRLWAIAISWPHLADGTDAMEASSPVADEKKRIVSLLKQGTAVALSEAMAKEFRLAGTLPFVTILSGPGRFDDTEKRRSFSVIDGKRKTQTAKGYAEWSLTIKSYAASEAEAESLLWPIVPYLPQIRSDDMGWNTVTEVTELSEGEIEAGAATATVKISLKVPAIDGIADIPAIRNARVTGKE